MIVTFKQTPFMHGFPVVDIAGETGFRAGCGLRCPRITWLKVARGVGVVENARAGTGARRALRMGRRANIGGFGVVGVVVGFDAGGDRVTGWVWSMGYHSVG